MATYNNGFTKEMSMKAGFWLSIKIRVALVLLSLWIYVQANDDRDRKLTDCSAVLAWCAICFDRSNLTSTLFLVSDISRSLKWMMLYSFGCTSSTHNTFVIHHESQTSSCLLPWLFTLFVHDFRVSAEYEHVCGCILC